VGVYQEAMKPRRVRIKQKGAALVAVLALALLAVACGQGPQETGTLQGHVTIGPLAR
jgi:hypothetical protein